jgi:3-hydroxybutyryl-CoA dehydratase
MKRLNVKRKEIEKFLLTEKQKSFEFDFFKDEDKYETWDRIKVGEEFELPKKFEVKLEDIVNFAEGIMDTNPLYHDEEYARKTPYGGIIAPPTFLVIVQFWIVGTGPRSWIRRPGLVNQKQDIRLYELVRPGDVLSIKVLSYDKYIKRGKYYVTDLFQIFNQRGEKVCDWYATLLFPLSKSTEKHRIM